MKRIKLIVVVILSFVLLCSSTAFATKLYEDVNMEESYYKKRPNYDNGPLICSYTKGSILSNSISGYTLLSVATDQTGTVNVYIKGSNGVVSQKYSNSISSGYVRSGPATVNGCITAEYVEHLGIRYTTNSDGSTYSQDWEYRFY